MLYHRRPIGTRAAGKTPHSSLKTAPLQSYLILYVLVLCEPLLHTIVYWRRFPPFLQPVLFLNTPPPPPTPLSNSSISLPFFENKKVHHPHIIDLYLHSKTPFWAFSFSQPIVYSPLYLVHLKYLVYKFPFLHSLLPLSTPTPPSPFIYFSLYIYVYPPSLPNNQ